MPTRNRPARSLLALAIVVNLVVAGVPSAAMGSQAARSDPAGAASSAARPGADAHAIAGNAPRTRTVDEERDIDLRGLRALDRPVLARATPPLESRAIRVAWVKRATPAVPQPKAKSVSTTVTVSSSGGGSTGASSPSSYKGRNHVWIPALGINRSVSGFACTSKAYPGNRVYRWGCAGRNNVYLFGHAYSVFKPLHDAYVRGRLSKNMKVMYADANGRVSTYKVAWWKVVTPDKGAFAYAGQSRPSMTLQTCVGAKSQFRLVVRLLKVS